MVESFVFIIPIYLFFIIIFACSVDIVNINVDTHIHVFSPLLLGGIGHPVAAMELLYAMKGHESYVGIGRVPRVAI